ncbi:hypothetical protein [Pleionea litopenaei]|uniref:Uncharacterized protein n=1 Tax=Pleionea litopenaei TaxID=3070815 RepID=A0AA51RVL9_9GAMM|nr:hypothetical protein [Pleionea sp. HL-JVS1]WMS88407.1 hypothetical protein Q9312_05700 [Pleionea sp. HL-JVS1]
MTFIIRISLIISLSLVNAMTFAAEIKTWQAPISKLALIAQEISDDPITPVVLTNRGKELYIVDTPEGAPLQLKADVKSLKNQNSSSIDSVLALLGLTNQAMQEVSRSLKDKQVIIAIEYRSPGCTECDKRLEQLKNLSDDFYVIVYNISAQAKSTEPVNHTVE